MPIILSLIVILYLISIFAAYLHIFKERNYDRNPLFKIHFLNNSVVLGYFFLVTAAIVGIAAYKLLFFMPYSFGGYDEDGNYTSFRFYFSVIIGFGGAYFISHQLEINKNKIKNLFGNKEERNAYKYAVCTLDNIQGLIGYETAFSLVSEIVEKELYNNKNKISSALKQGMKMESIVWSIILNEAGDLVSSGNFHFYRGALNQTGEELLKIYHKSLSTLVELGALSEDQSKAENQALQECIMSVG